MLRVRTASVGYVGGPGLSTYYFLGGDDSAAAADAVAAVHHLFDNVIKGSAPNSVSFMVSGEVDVITAATGAITNTFTVTAPAVVAGTGGASLAPPTVAALGQLKTTTYIAGRRVQGRTFISPLAAAGVSSDGILTNTLQTQLGFIWADLNATLAAGNTPCVWHRPKAGSGGVAAPMTASSVPFKLAVLASRRD